jgi:catechol 2,3-dioxygenase-like lactoylglutathione lyase family enzyme
VAHDHIGQVALDCADVDRLIGFWSEALGYDLVHREEEHAILADPEGEEPRLFLQEVPEPKPVKNRMQSTSPFPTRMRPSTG